jgi:hypothetical protein
VASRAKPFEHASDPLLLAVERRACLARDKEEDEREAKSVDEARHGWSPAFLFAPPESYQRAVDFP